VSQASSAKPAAPSGVATAVILVELDVSIPPYRGKFYSNELISAFRGHGAPTLAGHGARVHASAEAYGRERRVVLAHQ
jgi:hypothetical protein